MKLLAPALLCALIGFAGKVNAQNDSLYIVTYTLGEAWDAAKKPNEQSFFKEHSTHLSTLRKSGVIKLGARYADKGMIVISAASYDKAQEIIGSDQAILNKLFRADIQRLNVFYEGCVEKPKPKN